MTRQMNGNDKTIIVIGGGVAGTSCIDVLFQEFERTNCKFSKIILISERRLVKRAINYVATGRNLESFDVAETCSKVYSQEVPDGLSFEHIIGRVDVLDHAEKCIVYSSSADEKHSKLNYDLVCLCHGSKPRQLDFKSRSSQVDLSDRIIVIRDTSSVEELKTKLNTCRRLVIVGNGGIGLELVSKIADCDKYWIIRDKSIGSSYFDSGAAKFLLDCSIKDEKVFCSADDSDFFKHETLIEGPNTTSFTVSNYGPALGPNWSKSVQLKGCSSVHKLNIMYDDEVLDILPNNANQEFSVRVITKKGQQLDCDMIVTAIGVVQNDMKVIGGAKAGNSMNECGDLSTSLERSSSDGGILVDNQMRTSLDQVYAAGDVISCDKWPTSELWFQMRLWTQARQMGYYAGRCISAHLNDRDPSIYFNFECFTHCTTFFGQKLVLLGRFNGQQVEKQFEVIARVEPKKDYIKILVAKDDGRIIGAVLVGDTGLEETIENLIHDRIDVSDIKMQLLDNTIDIEDYFD